MGRLRDKIQGFQPVILQRNDPVHPPAHYPQETEFFHPDIRYEEAPRPVPDSAFAGVGRDAQHAPTAIAQFQFLAINDILSHASWPFSLHTEPGALVVGMPYGAFNPIRERTNITMPKQGTLSDMTTVDGIPVAPPSLSKIAF
jgi:hypothetical protein